MSDRALRPAEAGDAVDARVAGGPRATGAVLQHDAPGQLSASPAALAAALARRLRQAGVAVDPGQAQRFAAALRIVREEDREELYWTARVTLVLAAEELPRFDAVFAEVFGGPRARTPDGAPAGVDIDGASPAADPAEPGQPESDQPESGQPESDQAGPEQEAATAMLSAAERLGERDFAALTAAELADVRALVDRITLMTPLRRTRRTRRRAHGRDVDLRRTLRQAGRSGAEPVRIARRERQLRPRRLVLLCDVSGSMQPYTRVFLGLLQGAVRSVRAEAFVFATRLTRVTGYLRTGDPDVALAQAVNRASDLAGGTRLGACLLAFVDRYGRAGMARGAVVVIMSDGWTRDADLVATQLARLRRLCRVFRRRKVGSDVEARVC